MFDIVKKLLLARQFEMEKGKIIVLGQPVVITPAWVFVYLLKTSKDKAKMGRLIYLATKFADLRGFSKAITEKYGFKRHELIKWMKDIAELAGWGQINIRKIDTKEKIVIGYVLNSPLPALYGPSKFPVDHVFRGLTAGALEIVFQEQTECIETQCIAMGNNCCEFIIKPRKQFSFTDPKVKEQIPTQNEYKMLKK
jgi:predicted hydrocarbon binding protein